MPFPLGTPRTRAFFWRVVLYLHLVLAAFWWWLMPGGFPPVHPRFWANEVFPFVVAVICGSCLWAERRGNAPLRMASAFSIPAFWLGATITGVALYPYSARRFLPPAIVGLTVVFLLFRGTFRGQTIPRRKLILAVVPAIMAAAGFVWTQRGDPPHTVPLNVDLPAFEANIDSRRAAIPINFSDIVSVHTTEGRVLVRQGVPAKPLLDSNEAQDTAQPTNHTYRMEIEPLLSFESRSPDRFWTISAPARFRVSPSRRLTSLRRDEDGLTALYRNDTESVLRVAASQNEARIEAVTRLEQPIYSHLNSFVAYTIFGCVKPAISFSACPDTIVDVEPFDYPVGRPIRLAYLDAAGRFHVVSAKRGEKGPFAEFGSGPLPTSVPLVMTVSDANTAVFRVTLDDWAAQADRSLSPTAGWGLAVNAIEFSLIGDADSGPAPVAIWVTLAATSVGRGWDSVGHAAGTYRNRMKIESINQPIRSQGPP